MELPGAGSGTINFELCAEDRAGNIGCSEAQSYEIGGNPSDDDTGCTCTQTPTTPWRDHLGWSALSLLGLALLRRRR